MKVKPFLMEIAERVSGYPELHTYTLVFPNRRAALFFQHYLAGVISKPVWSPRLLSIEDFFTKHSQLTEPDRLTLIFKLHQVYGRVMNTQEPFDRFYFWGDMLLRDFDEVDKYLVNAPVLFRDLSKLKELDATFDFLTEEQKQFLRGFWINFEEKPAGSKEEFLRVWRKLPTVYAEYAKTLRKDGLGYEGMIHREVAGLFEKRIPRELEASKVVFAGFNAFTRAEEMVVSKLVDAGAQVFWDLDEYYVNQQVQEAGRFFREYKGHPVLGKTIDQIPAHLTTQPKNIRLTGVPQRIGQAKLAGELLSEWQEADFDANSTVIVLPDESMLLPVLQSLPPFLSDVNVTMGFPLRNTPLYNLLDLLLEMQLYEKKGAFSHRQVSAILGHAYITSLVGGACQELRISIIRKNRIFIPVAELQRAHSFFERLFAIVEPATASTYLLDVVQTLGAHFTDRQSFDREYAFHFHRQLSRLHEVLSESGTHPDWRGYQKLFRQVVTSQRIPFTGEPLKGLQVMGVLETRNLDFENVIVLSLNEGMLPAPARQGSYIPHNIRRAYALPTHEHQDSIYAYLFYRLLQRARQVNLFYNTEPDVIGNGEMSRFLQQLIYESGLPIAHYVMHNEVQVNTLHDITIKKTQESQKILKRFTMQAEEVERRELTPSALNDYIDCRLRFYLKHIARLREAEEVEEELDARVFGNLLHDVAHAFYDQLASKKNGEIGPEDFRNSSRQIEELIDQAFVDLYSLDSKKEVEYEGQRVVVKAIAKEFMAKIIEHDVAFAPFKVLSLEEKHFVEMPINDVTVLLGGKIDRIDSKNALVRIIDYKTGKDELVVESVPSLFARDAKRNKAAFQTMLYAYLFWKKNKVLGAQVLPGLMNRRNLFEAGFSFGHPIKGYGKSKLAEDPHHFVEFEKWLQATLLELFDPESPFDQTSNLKSCQYCPYKSICRR